MVFEKLEVAFRDRGLGLEATAHNAQVRPKCPACP